MHSKIWVHVFLFCLTYGLQAQRRTQSLTEFKLTEFVTMMDQKIHGDKNAIYSPTLLLAWNDLRNSLGGSIEVDSVDRDLYLFNRSSDFENTLLKNDYTAAFKVAFNSIHVKAELKKTIPFLVPMTSYATELAFDGKEVPAFGEKGEGRGSAALRYYKDDNNVVVSLLPENPSQEILLLKTETKFHSMREAIGALEENIKTGNAEMQSGKDRWKFDFAKEDKLLIPKIRFDIKTDYPTMEEKAVHGRGMRLDVMELIQRTAFSLNEKGIEIESEGGDRVVFNEPVADDERKPKKIIFDKPFFIVIKRKESANPYLALWIANTELMR
jgi:hypothetical protein